MRGTRGASSYEAGGLVGGGAAAQIGLDHQAGAAAEPSAIDLNVLDDALHVVARLGERDALDPIDRVDLGIAGIAVALDPFLDPAAARIVAGEGEDEGAVVARDVVAQLGGA